MVDLYTHLGARGDQSTVWLEVGLVSGRKGEEKQKPCRRTKEFVVTETSEEVYMSAPAPLQGCSSLPRKLGILYVSSLA